MSDAVILSDGELHAYVDGALAPDRAAAVARFLADHPEEAARVAAWRAQAEAIRALYAPVLAEPVPERLRAAAAAPPRRAGLGLSAAPWGRVAAGIVLLVVGSASGWLLRDRVGPVAPSATVAASPVNRRESRSKGADLMAPSSTYTSCPGAMYRTGEMMLAMNVRSEEPRRPM